MGKLCLFFYHAQYTPRVPNVVFRTIAIFHVLLLVIKNWQHCCSVAYGAAQLRKLFTDICLNMMLHQGVIESRHFETFFHELQRTYLHFEDDDIELSRSAGIRLLTDITYSPRSS